MTFKPTKVIDISKGTKTPKIKVEDRIENLESIIVECLSGIHELLTAIKSTNSPSLEKIAHLIKMKKTGEYTTLSDINLSKMPMTKNTPASLKKSEIILPNFDVYFNKLIGSSTTRAVQKENQDLSFEIGKMPGQISF